MKIEKVKKLVANVLDKTEYLIDMINLEQALNYGLVLRKVHRLIKFNQNVWLKPYIDMNTDLKKNSKNDFEKDFFKLMNNAVFGKTMKNEKIHRDITNLSQQKRKETIWCQNQIIILQSFSKNIY